MIALRLTQEKPVGFEGGANPALDPRKIDTRAGLHGSMVWVRLVAELPAQMPNPLR